MDATLVESVMQRGCFIWEGRGSDFPLQSFADSALEKAKFHFFPVRYHNSVFFAVKTLFHFKFCRFRFEKPNSILQFAPLYPTTDFILSSTMYHVCLFIYLPEHMDAE